MIRTVNLIYQAERQVLIEMAKTHYLIFRSTRLSLLYCYHSDTEGYRQKQFTKSTAQKDLREALVHLFCIQGQEKSEAEAAADIYLKQALEDGTHMDELIDLLNSQTKKKELGQIDHVLELHIYLLKQATMQKNPDPNYEAILQEIQFNTKQQSESLHKLWMTHVENSKEGLLYESEEAFRLEQAFAAVRYRLMSLQDNFRASCRKYIEDEMCRQKQQQDFQITPITEAVAQKPQPKRFAFIQPDANCMFSK